MKWISVRERLPEKLDNDYDTTRYLIAEKILCGYFLLTGSYLGDGNWSIDGEVTHWMPLPEQPNEEE